MLRRIRTRSTKNVVGEIVNLYKTYGVKGFMCYDSETEILTKDRGFVKFEDLIRGVDAVAVLEPITNELRFEVPSRYIRKPFDGRLVTVSNRCLDIAVTPEHRMWVGIDGGAYSHVPAKDIEKSMSSISFSHRARWNGEKIKTFTIPAYVTKFLGRNKGSPKVQEGVREFDAGTWVRFMAWYLSEGSCYRPKVRNGRGYRICIKQSMSVNPHKVAEIKEILAELGYRNSYSSDQFHIDSKELYEYLRPFGTSHFKHVPKEFKEMSSALMRLFVETYTKGDGTVHQSGQVFIMSASKRMLDDLQEMCIKCGWWGFVSSKFNRLQIRKQKDVIINGTYSTSEAIGSLPYSGEVHCVTVSTGIVLVRRNGKAVWCGNCYDDELNVNPKMVELMNAIGDAQGSLGVEFKLRGFIKSQLFTDEQAKAMYRAGFRWILVGFESGSERILENINKKATRDENTRCMEIAGRHGLKVKALMSCGHPGESEDTIMATRDWLMEVQPADFDATVITTYPGTPYFDHAIERKDRPGVWTYEVPKNGDKLHAIEVDFENTADYYKGRVGEYSAFVFTDFLQPDDLVKLRDFVETDVRAKLNIPFNQSAPAMRYEHSMGQSGPLPLNILRTTPI